MNESSSQDDISHRLEARLLGRQSIVGIIGLGYVGLPLARRVAEAGFRVLGFDIDGTKVAQLNVGESYIRHVPSAALTAQVAAGRLSATIEFDRLDEPDAIVICVPTPLGPHREPDLSMVEATTSKVAARLRPGQLVVLESTTYPGTCRDVLLPLLETSGLIHGKEFFLAYSPEREDPGNTAFVTARIPKVVGADNSEALRLALAFYRQVVEVTVPVPSLATAEAVKLTENVFRAVNIALVNELKVAYAAMGIDIWQVIEAAKTKPFGFMPFYPGPGLGGHCIPIDPFYLTWKSREYGVATRFIELAGEINSAMPHYVLERLAQGLDIVHRRGFAGSRILMIGLAYKRNVGDVRESPALRLWQLLEARGAKVAYYDPHVVEVPLTRGYPSLRGCRSLDWQPNLFAEYHAALIATDHDGVDYDALVRHCPLVLDTRDVCARSGIIQPHVMKA